MMYIFIMSCIQNKDLLQSNNKERFNVHAFWISSLQLLYARHERGSAPP